MRLHRTTGRRPVLPPWGAVALGALLLFCSLASPARADEWNDTFSSPREFTVTQNMTARKGPGNSYEAMGIVPEGTSIWVTNITNGWHGFKLVDGRSAYIFRRYLKPAGKQQGKKSGSKAEQTPKPSKQPKAKTQPQAKAPPKKAEPEPSKPDTGSGSEKAAESDGEYDEPIVESVAEQTDKTGKQEEPDEPLKHQDPPEPPLLAEIPQGPEDEPVPPEKAGQSQAESEEAVKPKTRPVRSSSFGSDGCDSYQRIAFAAGSSEAKLKGNLASGKRVCYRFLGIEGNTVSLALEPADSPARLDVYTPASGHIAEKQKNFSWRCASTGDKIIVVRAAKAASYALQVTIQR